MPSPFPGMDPYLEGYLWPDVHTALANKIRQQLTPILRPRYVARLELAVVQDSDPVSEIGIMYPDIEVVRVNQQIGESRTEYTVLAKDTADIDAPEPPVIPPAPLIIPIPEPVEVRLVTVEIRDVANNELITSIEILSPINKREPGLIKYRQKRLKLRQAGVHLLEIDLLRRGTRPWLHPRIPDSAYLMTLTRARANRVEAWPIDLSSPLPVLPVPLRSPDPDVPLALASALAAIYDEAAYDLSIDYSQPPPSPSFSIKAMTWLEEQIRIWQEQNSRGQEVRD